MSVPGHSKARCPDWYPSLRAARVALTPWHIVLGCEWSEAMETAALIAENAEAQAQEIAVKRSQKR